MSKLKVIFSGLSWTLINNIVNMLFGFISVPLLIGYFGKDYYGLIGIAGSVNVYIHLLDMGMTDTNVRFFSEYIAKGDKKKTQELFGFTYLFYIVIGIINSLILLILSFFVNDLFNVSLEQAEVLKHLLWILALNATFSWVSVCFDQYLRAYDLMSWLKKRTSFLRISIFAFLGITIIFKLPLEFYYFFQVFSITLILPLSITKVKSIDKKLAIKPSFNYDIFKTVFPYALTLFSFNIFGFLATNFRPLILGSMVGPLAVADFNVMNTIIGVITMFSGIIIPVLLPIVTKLSVNGETNNMNRMVYLGSKYWNIFLTLIIFGLVINTKELLVLYVGDSFLELSKWLTLWMITYLMSYRNIMTSLVLTERKLKAVAIMGCFAMACAFAAYFILIPKFGVGGAVIGFFVHELIHFLFYNIFFLPRRFKIDTAKIFFKSVLPTWAIIGLSGFFAVVLGIYMPDAPIIQLIVKCVVFIFLSILSIWFILFDKSDKMFIQQIIHNR